MIAWVNPPSRQVYASTWLRAVPVLSAGVLDAHVAVQVPGLAGPPAGLGARANTGSCSRPAATHAPRAAGCAASPATRRRITRSSLRTAPPEQILAAPEGASELSVRRRRPA